MLLSENWLSRTYACCNLYVHQIFGTFMYVDTNSSVRSWQILYVNYVLQYVNGNAAYTYLSMSPTNIIKIFQTIKTIRAHTKIWLSNLFRGDNQKKPKQELFFLHMLLLLDMIYVPTNYYQIISNSIAEDFGFSQVTLVYTCNEDSDSCLSCMQHAYCPYLCLYQIL